MNSSAILLITLGLSALSGCRSANVGDVASESDGTANDRRGIGEACRKDSDCLVGAACSYGSCDFKDPCSVTSTGPGGVTTRMYAYDKDGRATGITHTRDGKVVWRDGVTWSEDGMVASWKSWESDNLETPPAQVWTNHFDAAGDLTRSTQTFGDGGREETTYQWPDDWACRAPSTTFESGGQIRKTRATCDKDGAPERIDQIDARGTVVMSRRYTYRDGRLAERVTDYMGNGPAENLMRLVFERDSRGAVTAMSVDHGADGTVEQRDVYDLGCWSVSGDRVVYTAR